MFWLVVFVGGAHLGGPGDNQSAVLVGGVLVYGLIGGFQLWAGLLLRQLKPQAKVPALILGGLSMLSIPVGTLLGGYLLYLVLSKKGKEVLTDEYQAVVSQTPHIRYKTSPVLWVVLAALVLGLVGLGVAAAL